MRVGRSLYVISRRASRELEVLPRLMMPIFKNEHLERVRTGSLQGISLFLPYERNMEQVRMPAPVGSGGLG
jgi:hypothetical protein